MYLTRMPINPARREARKLLGSPQAMHAAVLLAFPETPTPLGDGPRVLWRLDASHGPRAVLYITSPEPPDLTHVVEQAGWPTTTGWDTRPYEKFLATLAEGQRWAFRITANTVHSAKSKDGSRGKRYGHVTAAQQQQWLVDRSGKNGFRIADGEYPETLNLLVHNRKDLIFKRDRAQVKLTTATFDGVLTVTSPDALRHALTAGIGRGKGYGCGLLTLAAEKTA